LSIRRYSDPARFIVTLSRFFLFVVLTASAALAQAPTQNWFPQVIENFGRNASSRTEFSLDHSMLVLASKVDQDDDSLRHIIAGVDGVSVHRFHFQNTGMYDPRIVNAAREEYHRAGWQRIAGAHDKNGGPGSTELWVHLQNNAIRNIDVLSIGRDQVNFVAVSGSISPIDLMHLAGHFGIPRMQGGVVLPTPGAEADSRGDVGQSSPSMSPGASGQSSSAPADSSVSPDTYGQPESRQPESSPSPNTAPPPSNKPSPDVDYRHPNSAPQPPAPQAGTEPEY
jgi:hypothetical protein